MCFWKLSCSTMETLDFRRELLGGFLGIPPVLTLVQHATAPACDQNLLFNHGFSDEDYAPAAHASC